MLSIFLLVYKYILCIKPKIYYYYDGIDVIDVSLIIFCLDLLLVGEYLKKKGEQMNYANWQKDIEAAFSALHKAVTINPDAAYIHHELGFLYMATQQFEQAEN